MATKFALLFQYILSLAYREQHVQELFPNVSQWTVAFTFLTLLNKSVTIQNLVRHMRISVFNFVNVDKPKKFWNKQMVGKTRQTKHITLQAYINWRNPWDGVTADIRQETPTPSYYRRTPPSHISHPQLRQPRAWKF